MTRAGRRPDCSRPGAGSSSAQTTMPLPGSVASTTVAHGRVPVVELVPVVASGAAHPLSEGFNPPSQLLLIVQDFDQPRGGLATLLRPPVDPVAQLHRHLDRGRHTRSIRNGSAVRLPAQFTDGASRNRGVSALSEAPARLGAA